MVVWERKYTLLSLRISPPSSKISYTPSAIHRQFHTLFIVVNCYPSSDNYYQFCIFINQNPTRRIKPFLSLNNKTPPRLYLYGYQTIEVTLSLYPTLVP